MADKSWSELLAQYSPELTKQSQEDTAFIRSDSALPAWVKLLMAMQLDSIFNHPKGARSYGKQAVDHGATKEQVVEAIKILRMYGGRPAMATGAEALQDL
jgi:alkylhydroperoxidase/carboxymuconolactone decarboxylase family protein YurZ